MADEAPQPGTIRITGTGTANTTRIDVLMPDGEWLPLRGVSSYRVFQGSSQGKELALVTIELCPLALARFEQMAPREQVALRLAGADVGMVEEAKLRLAELVKEEG